MPDETWRDVQESFEHTFHGGYHSTGDIKIFQHGMATVFNYLAECARPPHECRKPTYPPAACEPDPCDIPPLNQYGPFQWNGPGPDVRCFLQGVLDAGRTR